MSDDLSALIRAAALEDEVAAGAEFPYSAATLGRHVRDVRRRRVAGGAMLAVAGVLVIGGAAFGVDRLLAAGSPSDVPIGDPTSSVTSTPDRTATPRPAFTPTPTPTPTPSAPVETVTPPVDEETTPPPVDEETTPPPVELPPAPPGAVTITYSGEGGGSGEITVAWTPIDGATGYRVYRADAPDGPFTLSATFDVATASTSVAYSGRYEYIKIWQPLAGDYTNIQYTEAVVGSTAWFRVSAFNAGGEGPLSGVVCGEPPTVYSGPGC